MFVHFHFIPFPDPAIPPLVEAFLQVIGRLEPRDRQGFTTEVAPKTEKQTPLVQTQLLLIHTAFLSSQILNVEAVIRRALTILQKRQCAPEKTLHYGLSRNP